MYHISKKLFSEFNILLASLIQERIPLSGGATLASKNLIPPIPPKNIKLEQ